MSPQVGEVLTGKILACNKEGIVATMGGLVPVRLNAGELMKQSFYDGKEKLWVWRYENYELFYDIGESIRFRVAGVDF